jgi:hypothetical protein
MTATARHTLFLSALALALPRAGRAEDSVAYKYEDYYEGDGRVAVQTQSAQVAEDVGTDTAIKLSGTIDAIAGATPTGAPAAPGSNQVPETFEHDRRKAWTGDVSHQFGLINVDTGFGYSRESDYTSHAYSINTVTDFNQKNTELLAGASINEDLVHVLIAGPAWRDKDGGSGFLGVTQVLDANTSVSFDLTWARSTGFNSDQYKLVQKSVQIFGTIFLPETYAENRPDSKDKGSALFALNHAFPSWKAAIDASYRYYADTYGVAAHTVELSWLQHVAPNLIVQPLVRYYQQQAAKFYYYNLDDTNIVPVTDPTGRGVSYSSDYRLSAMRTYTYGLKVVWDLQPWVQLTLAFDKYDMAGMDRVTPQSAYPRAKITTAGVKFTW